jgi:2,4-didehydro-3-deoxy-L-rhamnonate hydrolase
MKLLRYGPAGAEKPGLLDTDGNVRDLSTVVGDITPDLLNTDGLARLRALDHRMLQRVEAQRLGVPVAGIGKIVAIGLNYVDHAEEANLPIPAEPLVFLKATSSLSGPNDIVVLPENARKGDWEVELGIVISRRTKSVSEANALDHIAGYCLVNDVSEREYQMERGGTWDKGKGCDTFGPVGPWLVTADEVPDPQALDLWLDVNGKRMQAGNTSNMIFGCAKIISYVSQFITLLPGDLVITGTPAGVGLGVKPAPVFLKPGDVMMLGIAGLGEQRQAVRGFASGDGQ